jgi:putative CocE/NonD family hydrolase
MMRKKWLSELALISAILFCSTIFANSAVAQTTVTPKTTAEVPKKPALWSDKSYYLPMKDGTRLAISIYFPDSVAPKKPAPILLQQTRYGRASPWRVTDAWRKAGFVVVVVDTRGSTASFGPRDADISIQEINDMDEIVAHIIEQPWSDGNVIASGFSYMADTADIITSRNIPALKAAIPRQTDFDAWTELFFPGGVANDFMMQGWGGYGYEIDHGRDGLGKSLDCLKNVEDCPKLFPTLQPVDGDEDYKLLRQALSGRNHWKPDDYADVYFRDQKAKNGMDMMQSSPAGHIKEIIKQNKPVQYWGSWMDAGTAEAALARFRTASELPAEVWITANNHGHNILSDQFFPDDKAALPEYYDQYKENIDFARRVLNGEKIARNIHYYVIGAKQFKDTPVWPPKGVKETRLSFGANNKLSKKTGKKGIDSYKVDFTATTGKATRWSTQFGPPAAYGNRDEADKKLIIYDAEPMIQDMELVGYAVADIIMSAATKDPAVFVYLEDVAPDGRVTYLTEGQFRAIHRKSANNATLPYNQGPAPHSFNAADATDVIPNQEMRLNFALNPVAALIKKGHHLRVSIAGADADTFKRYSEGKEDTFNIIFGKGGSSITVPMRSWKQ